MKNFLAVFTGTPEATAKSGWDALSESARNERTQAGIAAAQNTICGYVVVSAQSHEAAARLFENHPHFSIFPGEAVEVMECLPVPGA
jgi:hypothetical protein